MRTDRFADTTGSADGSLSRRTFVAAGGSAAGAVVGAGLASADDGDDSRVVGATEPYVALVREAAASTGGVAVGRVRDLEDPPDLRVSGRPGADAEVDELADVRVDGRASLANLGGRWRDALRPAAVREHWTADAPVEAWSEVTGDAHAGVGTTERPDAMDEVTPLVRGTRAYQYARGRGGVGYYDVDGTAIRDAGQEDVGDGGDAVPIVRIAYVHARRDARSDDRLAAFLEEYGDATTGPGDAGATFLDPAVEE